MTRLLPPRGLRPTMHSTNDLGILIAEKERQLVAVSGTDLAGPPTLRTGGLEEVALPRASEKGDMSGEVRYGGLDSATVQVESLRGAGLQLGTYLDPAQAAVGAGLAGESAVRHRRRCLLVVGRGMGLQLRLL